MPNQSIRISGDGFATACFRSAHQVNFLPQAHLAKQVIPGYKEADGVAISLLATVHKKLPATSRLKGDLSTLSAAEVRSRVLQQLRDLENAGVPDDVMQQLIGEIRRRYPSLL